MNETLSPQERIRKKKDFSHLYKKGKRYNGKYLNLVYLANDLIFSRMAVIVSAKAGNAVKRNRVKRRIRALFRRNKDLFKSPYDIIVIARKEIIAASWPELKEDYFTAINSIFQGSQSR
jgi:ribonuclease P protein component